MENQCEVLVSSRLCVMNALTPETSECSCNFFTDAGPVVSRKNAWHKENQPQTVETVRFFAGITRTLERFNNAGNLDAAIQTLSNLHKSDFDCVG